MRHRTTAFLVLLGLAAAAAHGRELEVTQKGKVFMHQRSPVQQLKVKVGDTVSFRNDDPFFHNVYSASSAKAFDLGSYPQGQTRKVMFEKEGVVEVECAIHPDMKLKVEVSP